MEITLESMNREYLRLSKADSFIIGFERRGNIYKVCLEKSLHSFAYVTTLSTKSEKDGKNPYIKCYVPARKCDEWIKRGLAEVVCTEKYFNEVFSEMLEKDKTVNRGHVFEKIIKEKSLRNYTWKKDNTSFKEGGDMTLFDICFEIKFTNGTFAELPQLMG